MATSAERTRRPARPSGGEHVPSGLKVVLAKGALRGPISGASETLVTYASHLRRSGHDASVLLLYPPRRGDPYWRRLRSAGVPVVSAAPVDVEGALLAARATAAGMRRSPALPDPARRAGRSMLKAAADRYSPPAQEVLRRSGADLVHVVGQDPGAGVLIGAAHAVGLPVLFQELGGATRPSVLAGFIATLPLCSEVAALSPQIARRVADVLPVGGRVSVLPIITEPPEGASRSGRSPAPLVFGFASRLDPGKGSLVMVEAFARARRAVPGIRLRVTGGGPERHRMLARARALGVADACDRPRPYARTAGRSAFMRSVDVLLLPSDTEGTPNCIVEAMAHGLPVIATSVGGIPDVVTPDVGILVPPHDAGALAAAMASLADDGPRRARMASAAAERYQRLFSPEAVMPVLLETYRRVVDPSGRPAPARHEWSECGNGS